MQQLDDDVRWKVLARGDSAPQSDDHAVIADYFNLGTSLSQLADLWAAQDVRFSTIREYIPGVIIMAADNPNATGTTVL